MKAKKIKKELKKESTGFVSEFKEFITRGNVVELAVGLTVGTAFTTVVKSLVDNLVMPVIGLVLSGEEIARQYVALDGNNYDSLEVAELAGAPLLKYGQLISDFLDFIIIALAIFVVIKVVTGLRKKEEESKDNKKASN